MSLRLLLPLAALCILIMGCATSAADSKPQAELLNTLWRFTEVAGVPVTTEPDQREPSFVLKFDGERVTGFAGCNQFSGSFTSGPGLLDFGELMSTRMACPQLDTEQRVFEALAKTTAYTIEGERLTLLEGSSPLAVCEAVYLP